jgi:hypothetical protein
MPIDTEAKRRSASQMPWMHIAPVADGTIGAADRIHATGYYAGIPVGAPSAMVEKGLNMGLLLGVYRS